MSDPQSTGEIMIALLRSIDGSLKLLANELRARTANAGATDRDLDGKYGNPEVRLKVRDWTGAPMRGRRMSECPPEFLDMLAETLNYLGGKEEREGATYNGKLTAPYTFQNAARARGWAKRMREGKVAPPEPETASSFGMANSDSTGFGDSGFEEESDADVAI